MSGNARRAPATPTAAARGAVTLDAQPVRRRKLYQDIVERMEQLMLSGRLQPGDLLPSERELMQTFEVGRTSVREALFALQRMGLIEIRNGERPCVTRPSAIGMVRELSGAARHMLSSPDGAREFQQARGIIEVALARYAAEHATEADIAALRQALALNGAAIDDMDAFTRTDVAFHLRIAEVTRNSIFSALNTAVNDWLAEQRTVGLGHPDAARAAFKAHGAICEAIAAHRPDEAERAMRAHLAEVEAYYWAGRGKQSRGAARRGGTSG